MDIDRVSKRFGKAVSFAIVSFVVLVLVLFLYCLLGAGAAGAAGDCIFPDADVEQFWNHGKGWFPEPKGSRMKRCAHRGDLISYTDYLEGLDDQDHCLVVEYRILYNSISGRHKLQSRMMPLWETRLCCDYREKPPFQDHAIESEKPLTLKDLRKEIETLKRYDFLELISCQEKAKIEGAWKPVE